MLTEALPNRRRLFAAALLALFACLPATAHNAFAHSVADAATVPDAAEVVTGTVRAVVIEDRIKNETFTYRELRLDDGAAIPLRGTVAESLQNGARVRVGGKRFGAPLEVVNAETLAPLPTAPATAAEVQGKLAIAHADDFVAGKSRYIYQVHDDAGRITTLSVGSLPTVLRGGSRVIVSGKRGADTSSLQPERITILAAPASGSDAKTDMIAKAMTTSNVLVILANFNNTAAPAYTAAQAQQVMSSSAYSVANYYSEVSYGQQLLNVTVTSSWVTMNMAASCDFTSIGNAANTAALAANPAYNVANYANIVYLFPAQGSCGWSGLAYVGWGRAWINGTGAFSTQVIAHEMGHNFGLLHAGRLNCGAVSIGGSCSVTEYGDPFDTMGNSHAMHLNATQKSMLNWIPASSVKTHTSGSVNYTLDPIESPGGSVYAVKIPTAFASRTYWLEFRQPIGFDSPSNPQANFSWANNGAQIRVSSPFEWTSGSDDTEILDMTPATSGNFSDAALVTGQSFTDSTYGINVIVTGASAGALTVNVTTSGGTATTTTLISSSNPSNLGTNVTFTATVAGVNPTGSVNFKDGAGSIAACSAVALTGSGNSRTAACTTNTLTAGAHSIVATYSGDAANATSSSATLSQTVTKVTSTTGIGSSLTPSTFGTSVTFTATVSGSAPTGSVNFKDGATLIAACSTVALTGSGNIRSATCATSSLGVGTHGIAVVYSGDAINNGSTSAALSQVVNGGGGATTTTTLSSSSNPSTVGTNVTFTATVTGTAPTGTVNFKDGAASIAACSAVLLTGSGNARTAQCSTSALSTGTRSIVASYGGDANNTASNSSTLSQGVNSVAPPATLVNASFEIPALGTGYQYNANVSGIGWTFSAGSGIQGNGSAWGAATAPNGTQTAFIQGTSTISQAVSLNAGSYALAFKAAQRPCCLTPNLQPIQVTVDGTQIGSLVTPAGTSFASISILFTLASSGTHIIAFAGTNPNSNTTFVDGVTLTAVLPGTVLASSLNPAKRGQNVTFTSTITGNNPTGSVAFTSDGNPIAGCAAVALTGSGNSKTAQCPTNFAATGTYSIVASYGGNANNAPTVSSALSEVIKRK